MGVTLSTLIAVLSSGCASQMRLGGSLRGEMVQADAQAMQRALRADLRATASAPIGRGRLDAEAAPSFVAPMDGTTVARALLRGRAGYTPDARARWAPSLTVGVERGTTRASDVAGDAAEPRPDRETLTADRISVDAALRARLGSASAATATVRHEASGGVGEDVRALPRAVRSTVGLTLSGRGPGASSIGGFVRADRAVIGDALPWVAQSIGAQWRAPLGPGRTMEAEGGLLRSSEASASLHPTASVRLRQSARAARPGLELAVSQSAEPDRLDGRVRDRRRVALAIETAAVSTVSFRGSVQALSDADAEAPRRALGLDAVVRVRLAGEHRMEYGVAHLVQSLGAGPSRGETRVTIAFRSTLAGTPCRNSC